MPRTLATLLPCLLGIALAVLSPGRVSGQPAGAAVINGFEVHGGIDPPGRIEQFIASLIPTDTQLVEGSDPDQPPDTVSRLQRALDRVGYHAVIAVVREAEVPAPGGRRVRLAINLRPYDRIRQIFVTGNWPLRQDEITRRLSFRPGQPLPLAGPERDARVEQERQSVLLYLQSQGYREAQVAIDLHSTNRVPSPVNLLVRMELGPGYPLGAVTVTGSHALPPTEVQDAVRHSDWRWLWLRPAPFRLAVVREDLAKLTLRLRGLGYPGARVTTSDPEGGIDPSRRNVKLDIEVRENRRVEVGFEGNQRFSNATLREQVTIFSRGAYDQYEIESSAESLTSYHRERGQMLAHVRWRRERLPNETDRVVFTIDEGPLLKVRGVTFSGHQAFTAGRLAAAVRTRPFPLLGALGIGSGGYTSVRQLEIDGELLLDLYRSAGYPEARVFCSFGPTQDTLRPLALLKPADQERWRGSRSLYAHFAIQEGRRVVLGAIGFSSLDGQPLPHDDEFLRTSLRSRLGQPWSAPAVRDDAEHLKRILGDAGYPGATVEPDAKQGRDGMALTWQVKLGRRMVVGPVFLRGNFFSRERTVLQWVPLRPGQPYTTTAFERGQRDLALSQLFSNASPLTLPGDISDDGTVPMLIEVEERHDHWGVLRLGGGASTEQVAPGSSLFFGGYASAGYEHRNLFGLGWTALTRLEYGNSLTRATANLVEPRFLGTRFRLETSGSYLRQATVRLGDIRSGTGSVGFARELYPGVDAALRYNLRNTFRTETLLRVAGADEGQETVRIGTLVAGPLLSIEWLRLDNQLLPSRGFKLFGSVEMAHPAFSLDIGHATFIKTHARSLVVVPLSGSVTLRHSVRYDQGFPLGGGSVLPKVERFFAGGDTTIRGYDLDRARTETVLLPFAPGVAGGEFRPVGGSLRILHNVDIQFPIARPLYAGVFIDSGVVADSFDGLRPGHFRHGVGVSPLIVKLPIGDISLSWAWPLDPMPGDARIGRLHFNVGLMF